MAKIIQLGVWDFCEKFLNLKNDPKGRQFDQTTQAARAVPANIAEGSARRQTSRETEMKLIDVARASLSETIEDLSFICMRHGQPVWTRDDPRVSGVRQVRLDKANYSDDILHDAAEHVLRQKSKFDPWLKSEDILVQANALIILCSRTISMLKGQLQHTLEQFKQTGGFTENMTQERLSTIKTQNLLQGAPLCQRCGAVMVKYTAKKGVHAGRQFWSCSNYRTTGCSFTLSID
ncbi:MAG: four helix bundle suffix domain-containing protein [Bacteroidales bacterium]|nr:four helix bundle suffix domain-containing protein [Bacteroidales bacterium]